MKQFLMAVLAATVAALATPAHAADVGVSIFAAPANASNVGVSISIGQPGFYGHIDIGGFPVPQLVEPRPVIIEHGVRVDRPPIYLRVPARHRKHWKKYCHRYNACGERVLFVKDSWYNDVYVPHYKEKHSKRRVERRKKRRDDHERRKRGGRDRDRKGRR